MPRNQGKGGVPEANCSGVHRSTARAGLVRGPLGRHLPVGEVVWVEFRAQGN